MMTEDMIRIQKLPREIKPIEVFIEVGEFVSSKPKVFYFSSLNV